MPDVVPGDGGAADLQIPGPRLRQSRLEVGADPLPGHLLPHRLGVLYGDLCLRLVNRTGWFLQQRVRDEFCERLRTGSDPALGEYRALVPELAKRYSFAGTAILSGFIWAIWHYPILLLGDYNGHTPVWYYLPLFTLLLPVMSFLWAWMRLKSGSIWPGVVLHAAHNTFIQQFFDPLTVDNSKTRYVAGEFGAALAVISILMAVYFWKRRAEVSPPAASVTAGTLA
jgi:hypothetical protein